MIAMTISTSNSFLQFLQIKSSCTNIGREQCAKPKEDDYTNWVEYGSNKDNFIKIVDQVILEREKKKRENKYSKKKKKSLKWPRPKA